MTAEGSVYQRKDGRWCAQYRDVKDKVRYIYRKTKQEARKALREALKDRDDNIVPPSKMTVGLYLDEWMEERKNTVSGRTWKVQESIIRCRVKPHIGDNRLCKLAPSDVRGLYRRLIRDGLSPSTVGHVHVFLKGSLQDAVRDKRIRTNPVDDVKPPRQDRKEKAVLTPEEVKRLLEAVSGDRYECAFYLLALTGLRIGECLAMSFDSLDLQAGTITISSTLHNGECLQTKTASSNRTLTLPKRCLEALTRLCKVNGGGLQLERRWYVGKDGHRTLRGPYWYFRYHENGKQKKIYLGKTDSPESKLAEKRGVPMDG
jgi:integrase